MEFWTVPRECTGLEQMKKENKEVNDETLTSSLTKILLFLTKLQLSPKPVTITFANFAVSVNCLYHCYLYRSLQT